MNLEHVIADYQMSPETTQLVRQTKLLLIAGIVGGGKNTVISELLKSSDYHEIVSHTTRAPRLNHDVMERDGVDYHFVTPEQAEKLLTDKAFIEAKYVHGNVYGTTAAELVHAREADKVAVTDIDVHGVTEYLNIKPDTHAIFLLPPSVETWLSRLEKRYGNLDEHQAEITKRFQTAYREISHIKQDPRFILVVNDDLKTTVDRVSQIVRGERDHTSDFALSVADHLLDYLKTRI